MSEKNELFSTDTFESLGLDPKILKGIADEGFEHPTHVQANLIPLAISGRDVLGQSKTGTGKTAAFALPALQLALDGAPFSTLILTPTRELAIQVAHEMRNLARHTNLKIVPVYGGQKMTVQIPKLERKPQIIVGTPGRVMDFNRRGILPYNKLRLAILDEVDRMLDIGFREDIRKILGAMKQKHQTIFVSATISPEIEKLSGRYMHDPVALDVTNKSKSLTVDRVKQHYFNVQRWDKFRLLLHLLQNEDTPLVLIFCRTKQTVDSLTTFLNKKKIEAHAMHGDMYQAKRNKVMQKLRNGELKVLVASDLAARGLDVDDITHVINFDLPEDPEVYVHRIGRTARAGRGGLAWAFVTPEQGDLLSAIERLTNVEIPVVEYDDFEPGPEPPDVKARRERAEKRREEQRAEGNRNVVAPPSKEDAKDDNKFPGGAVPVAVPERRMRGRVRTRRR